jgi:hypothetical protein
MAHLTKNELHTLLQSCNKIEVDEGFGTVDGFWQREGCNHLTDNIPPLGENEKIFINDEDGETLITIGNEGITFDENGVFIPENEQPNFRLFRLITPQFLLDTFKH